MGQRMLHVLKLALYLNGALDKQQVLLQNKLKNSWKKINDTETHPILSSVRNRLSEQKVRVRLVYTFSGEKENSSEES